MIVFNELQKKKITLGLFLSIHCYQKHDLHFYTRFILFYSSDTVGFFFSHPVLNQLYLFCLCFWL